MLSGANAFEISDTEEDEAEAIVPKRPECNNVTLVRKPLNGVVAGQNNNSPETGEQPDFWLASLNCIHVLSVRAQVAV
jgi:hypothetical protein